MKNFIKLFSLIFLFGLFLACTSKDKEPVTPQPAPADPQPVVAEKATVIYIVRHAEKGTNSPTDPDLSAAGQARALVLKDSLNKVPVAAIYSTNYKRTQQTAAPTATVKSLNPVIYDSNDLKALADKILKDNLNQTVLIVGHSNTVLETIEAFQAQRPVAVVNDSEYNYLFKVTLKENKAPVVEVKRYGK